MSLADRIVLMNQSKIVQVAEPDRMFFEPASIFAGQFIGSPSMNLMDLVPVPGGLRLAGSSVVLGEADLPRGIAAAQRKMKLGVRPRDLRLVDGPGHELAIDDIFSVGRERFFTFRIGDSLMQGTDHRACSGEGRVRLVPEGLMFFDAETGLRISGERVAA